MQLNRLRSSSGATSCSDAGLQEPNGFALRIAVDSSALLCEPANGGRRWLTRSRGQVLALRSDT